MYKYTCSICNASYGHVILCDFCVQRRVCHDCLKHVANTLYKNRALPECVRNVLMCHLCGNYAPIDMIPLTIRKQKKIMAAIKRMRPAYEKIIHKASLAEINDPHTHLCPHCGIPVTKDTGCNILTHWCSPYTKTELCAQCGLRLYNHGFEQPTCITYHFINGPFGKCKSIRKRRYSSPHTIWGMFREVIVSLFGFIQSRK